MKDQESLFPEFENEWEREWHDMPEFIQEDKSPIKQLIVSFKSIDDYKAFGELIGQKLTRKTQSVWHPQVEIEKYMDKRYSAEDSIEADVSAERIPRRFIRCWFGDKEIPEIFEKWWAELKEIHKDYEFITITHTSQVSIPETIKPLLRSVGSFAGVSDIIRILALYQIGGVYVDTDIMPLKSFNPLLEDSSPFLAKRSSKSFESAVIGSPKGHPAFKELIEKLPEWFEEHKDNAASVQTGPAFVSSVLFNRSDIRHLQSTTFYPYNGFMAPKKNEKYKLFEDKNNFPPEMIAAHLSNHIWGGNPNKKNKV